MKRNLITLLLACFCATSLFAENPLFKPGMKLLYKVESFGSYDFAVKPVQVAPDLIFDWNMSHRAEMFGRVTIKKDALASATKQMNEFTPGETTLTDMTSVVLSSAVYKSLKAGKPVKMNTGGGEKTFTMKETQSFKFKIDGVETEKKVLFLESDDKKQWLWVLDDELPLIVKMSIGFSISLQEVVTEKPVSNLITMLGMSMNSPEGTAFVNRIKKSCWITVEDLSDEEGEDKYWEYFCPIEGIRVRTKNDKIYQMLVYRDKAEHDDFTYRATDMKLPYGLTLTMTRKDVEATLGKPDANQDDPGMVAYPDKHLVIYYGEGLADVGDNPKPQDRIWFVSLETEEE